MSLGFNTNRKRTASSLPGSVGATTFAVRQLRRSSRPTQLPTPLLVRPVDPRPAAVILNTAVPENENVAQEHHSVFGTASVDLVSRDGDRTTVVSAGSRAMFVYPMTANSDECVSMRVKSVNPITGQLSYDWVCVYDPSTDERYVTDFSLEV